MTTSAYDGIAEWYDTWVGTHSMRDDPYFPAVEALLGEVAGQRVLDLACGQGRGSRYLAEMGASVVGVDISQKLLAIARHHEAEQPRGITYRYADAQTLAGIEDSSFEIVVSHMALMDIPELEPTLHSVARVLRAGGRFVFAILHPCYNPAPSGALTTPEGVVRTVSGYFDEGYWRSDARTGPPGKVGSYHRTLSTYVNALTDAGLAVKRMSEPPATPSVAAVSPVWSEVPAALVVQCRKVAPRDGS